MKRVFNAKIIWDNEDSRGLAMAVDDLVEYLNTREYIKAITPHVYPEDPIIVEITPPKINL